MALATIRGVWVRPGVSKNRRLYTKAHIAEAVAEAQQALKSGDSRLVAMLTHHGARDPKLGDVRATAGRVTKVGLDKDGNGTFEAELADTDAGRDVAALVTPDHPFLRGVSMAAVWKSAPKSVRLSDGTVAETADGFSLRGIDFTHSPGVVGAEITSATAGASQPAEATAAGLIFEDAEEVEFVDETITEGGDAPGTGTKPYGDVTYADPGYQKDGKKRYPLDTKAHVRAAWSYVNQEKNGAKYTAAQLKRIKSKIQRAAKKFGVQIAAEEAELVSELSEVIEAYASMTADNGQASVTASGYTNEPADVQAIAKRLALAVMAGMQAVDPDNDGDIDVDDDESDDDMESCQACNADLPDDARFCPECGSAVPSNESDPTTQQEGLMATTPEAGATEAAPETVTITKDELKALVAEAVKEATVTESTEPEEIAEARRKLAEYEATHTAAPTAAPAAAPATEAAPVDVKALVAEAIETTKQAMTEAYEAKFDEARKLVQMSGPQRRGLIAESETPEQLYGSDDPLELRKASTSDLEKVADRVMAPLIAASV